MSKSDAENTLKALNATDDASSDEGEEMAKGGEDDAMSAEDESGDSASGGDDESSDDGDSASDEASKKFGKSHGAAQLANASSQTRRQRDGNLRKALVDETPNAEGLFDAAPILGKLVDSIDKLAGGQPDQHDRQILKSMRKSVRELGANQGAFNTKIAKALVMMFERLDETRDMVKAMHDTPVPNARGTTLRKSDIREPQFGNGDTTGIDGRLPESALSGVEVLKIQEQLYEMCTKSMVTLDDVTKWENSRYDFNMLPTAVVQQLEKRLCSAS